MGAPTTRSSSFQIWKRWLRISPNWLLWVLGGIGVLLLLASGWQLPGARTTPTTSPPLIQVPALSSQQSPVPPTGASSARGSGAGGRASLPVSSTLAAGICLPGDTDCLMQSIGQSLAKQIIGAVQPVVKALLENPVDILFQTPAEDTYQNAAVLTLWNALMLVVTVALACLVVLGGYNVIVAPYFGLQRSSVGAFLPQLLLAFGAAHFSLAFLGGFIDLENTLCKAVMQTASLDTLTNAILGFSTIATTGSLFLPIIVLLIAILVICLTGQMIVRIGLIALLIVLAPLALICLALPQTQRYGRLWITLFTSSVLVQFFQVTALLVGTMLFTSASAANLTHLPQGIGQALLCIGVLYLVLKIPGMLNHWALGPMQAISSGVSVGDGVEAAQGYLQDQAARQASIEALATLI